MHLADKTKQWVVANKLNNGKQNKQAGDGDILDNDIKRNKSAANDIPIFSMGDFNTTPVNSACYVFRGQGQNYSVKDTIDPY